MAPFGGLCSAVMNCNGGVPVVGTVKAQLSSEFIVSRSKVAIMGIQRVIFVWGLHIAADLECCWQ